MSTRERTVFPERAPGWLRPALGVDARAVQERIGNRDADRFTQTTPPVRRESAVLVLFKGSSFKDGEVLLTHRSPTMRSHSGQIAFPGGRRDPEDATLVDVALREAWEETGLERASVTALEVWEQLHIRATGNPVSPVLAYWHSPGEVWAASPEETDDVFGIHCVSSRSRRIVCWWASVRGMARPFMRMTTSCGVLLPEFWQQYWSTLGGSVHGITIPCMICTAH